MKFCKLCDYTTSLTKSMNRHIVSKLHVEKLNGKPDIDNIIDIYQCSKCERNFSSIQSLNVHIKNYCVYTKINNLETEVVTLKTENISLKNENTLLKTENIALKEEMSLLKAENDEIFNEKDTVTKKYISELESHSNSCMTALSLVKYLIDNYKDAPKLSEPVKSHEKLKFEINVISNLIYKYRHKILSEHLGEMIIDEYKKQNHDEQSMWSSDSNRFSFIIKSDKWTRDQKGIKVAKIIISKITNRVSEILSKFIYHANTYMSQKFNIDEFNSYDSNNDSNDNTDSDSDSDDYSDADSDVDDNPEYDMIAEFLDNKINTEITELISDSIKIKVYIDNQELSRDILKFITPHFDILCLAIKNTENKKKKKR